ncbi:uncharacterized protein Z518_08397 [Rhinocladiella mackenziei CBS 650.93]|uniref:Rhinocladiella mackenziei CBS 650.93 unplaced genomic scaffold supercont1.6, whole genome shotgun sequence n=1 Tax=Rhinocladiella mackenziei CBS 650.93 TaxID=1442369 RepID=A0A0D2IGQ7_9EURO|nr:uncharacterized protein Z518_08397 [Rhinocladiella mackenziei CBS 650.93]KIX02456.1 hypothetical protein Z518_08397 [Rhinocladiella mackenziei CBS 650.93]
MRKLLRRISRPSHASASQDTFQIDIDPCMTSLSHLATEIRNPTAVVRVDVQGATQWKEIRHTMGHNAVVDDDAASGKKLFRIASLSKPLINLVYCIIIEDNTTVTGVRRLDWDTDAFVFYNSLCNVDEPKIEIHTGGPKIDELLLHRNAFADINRFLFAPDGTFMASGDHFIKYIPNIPGQAFHSYTSNSVQYSNANHIFAVLILEKMFRRDIESIMREYVFSRFGMDSTTTDLTLLDDERKSALGPILRGRRVSGDPSRCDEIHTDLLGDTSIASACFGTWSCADDLAGLLLQLIDLRTGDKGTSGNKAISKKAAEAFFNKRAQIEEKAYDSTFAGLLCDTTSEWMVGDSPDRLSRPDALYTLGSYCEKGKVEPQKIYSKGGVVDGFTSRLILAPEHRVCIVVLTNSTGPVDFSSHVAQCILQEVLGLEERHEIAEKVMENLDALCRPWRDLESQDEDLGAWPDPIDKFVGTYRNRLVGYDLKISPDSDAIFHTGVPRKSGKMTVRARKSTIRLFPGPQGFSIERLAEAGWKNLTLDWQEEEGRKVLACGKGLTDRYFQVRDE